MTDINELFNEAYIETFVKRPKEFFKKIHLWRVSEFDTPTIKPYSFNVGTKLSNGRFSSFWVSSEKDWAIFYGLRVLLTNIAMEKMGITSNDIANNTNKCRKTMVRNYRFDYNNIFFINLDNITEEDVENRCNSHPIFLYGKKVSGYETGLGWHNYEEYTLDKEVEFDSKEKLKYDDFKKFIKYLPSEEYIKKYEERLSKKDASGKKYDEDLGFPYFANPRKTGEERVIKYFNKMIRAALNEKDKVVRDRLMDELAEQYKLLNGYTFRLMKLEKDMINVPNEYKDLFESEDFYNESYETLFEMAINELDLLEELNKKYKKSNCLGFALLVNKDIGPIDHIYLLDELEKKTHKKYQIIDEKDVSKVDDDVIVINFMTPNNHRDFIVGYHAVRRINGIWYSKPSRVKKIHKIDNNSVFSDWNYNDYFKENGLTFVKKVFIKEYNNN